MKNIFITVFVTTLIALALCSCSSSSNDYNYELTKVGMVADTGTMDDMSFNQGVWQGILNYQTDMGTIDPSYVEPAGDQVSDHLTAITTLHDSGHAIIVASGVVFEVAVNEAADRFPDTKFILIDGITHSAESQDFVAHDNVVCVLFNEHEAGFLAGIAAALSTTTNQLGFIGGVDVPAVIRYGVGFRAGMEYANLTYATTVELKDENYVYQGSFNDVEAGKSLAAQMYDDDVDIIFSAAGMVGVGAINEAKERAELGDEVWAIGVDSDQYSLGVLASGKSVVLTSALKRVDIATYDCIDSVLFDTFPGAEVITLTLADNALGLPEINPNLAADVEERCKLAAHEVASGNLVVPSTPLDK